MSNPFSTNRRQEIEFPDLYCDLCQEQTDQSVVLRFDKERGYLWVMLCPECGTDRFSLAGEELQRYLVEQAREIDD